MKIDTRNPARRFCAALILLTMILSACATSNGSASTPQAGYACDAEVRRKVTCDHMYPQLADRARDLCERSWSCASTFWRPEALSVWVDCNARAPCSIDCYDEIDRRTAPLPEEIAFVNACRSWERTCSLDCARLVDGHRQDVAGFWNEMGACFNQPECGEPADCLSKAGARPAQAMACLF